VEGEEVLTEHGIENLIKFHTINEEYAINYSHSLIFKTIRLIGKM
jgi:hypothetical protein